MEISLGPLLGLEADDRYSVCFAARKKYSQQSLQLILDKQDDGQQFASTFETCIKLQSHYFYRFRLSLPAQDKAYSVKYHFASNGTKLTSLHRRKSWEFEVAGRKKMPIIGFCSCNGDSKRHPSKLKNKDFSMWTRMREQHEQDRFHLLLMGGDQVYADSIWDQLGLLNELKTATLVGGKRLTTKAVVNRQLNKTESRQFSKDLRAFYEQLYLDSWSNKDMSYMLGSVPSVMMWDDHDIFDGWGSYSARLQNSPVFKHIFPVAKEYFEIFQARTGANPARVTDKHFMQHLSFRNLEIVVLDNRSFRTTKQIMSKTQYRDLQKVLDEDLFRDVPPAIKSERVLCFVIAVPVAHLKYAKIAQKVLSAAPRKNFRHSLNDDALDHWDHANHEAEQEVLLDMMFEAGEKHKAKYVCIISGDVHTAGAATITKKPGQRKITQLISSGIAHDAPRWWERGVINLSTTDKSKVAGYNLQLKNFGNYKKFTISCRNYGLLNKAAHSGIVASLRMEGRKNFAHRTLNKFKR